MRVWIAFASLLAPLSLASPAAAADDAGAEFFEKKVRPVLVQRCYECHSQTAKKKRGGLLLDSRDRLRQGGDSGPAIVPGRPDESRLIKAIRYGDEHLRMPPKGKLPDTVIADLETWVKMGAPDPRDAATAEKPSAPDPEAARRHWAFQPLRKHPVPAVKDATWPLNDIDRFLLARLEEKGLRPTRDADRHTLLRRVTFDLTGLPPTSAEIEAFLADRSPQALDRVVDRLLASPAFGDRWGRHWLDIAQYADTVSVDRLFPDNNAWRYRDYVIRAFNEDWPFDRFIREQVAGDLLPLTSNPSPPRGEGGKKTPLSPRGRGVGGEGGDAQRAEQIVATAFLTHGPIQTINQFKEQLRWDIVDNQVGKVGQVFLGLTVGCARCHDHKFDPIAQKEYYALAGIFQNLQLLNGFLGDSKVFSDWVRVPLPESAEERAARQQATAEHARIRADLERQLRQERAHVAELEKKQKNAGTTEKPALTKELTAARQRAQQLDERLIDHVKGTAPQPPSMFAAHELAPVSNARVTVRGNAYQLGPEVPRGFLHIATAGRPPAIPSDASGRLQLADWLTDPKNPLTARVAVNRIWHHVFGAGLVRSVDNFGLRGDRPTHPELLDHLAQRFVERGWSVKAVIRELVLSRAYRMASDHHDDAFALDPDNKLLWRMSRRRLEAEAIRDAVLQVSGQLDRGRGGPSLPPAGWLPGAVNNYVMLKGEPPPPPSVARRRTVYLPVFRRPAPWADGLMLFNAPTPSVITGARSETTVPTQSLYLMNSPFLIEQGRKTAERLLARKDLSDAERVEAFYLAALSRPARPEEVQRALTFIQKVTIPDTESKPKADARLSAWGLFCHAVFASNEFLMRF
ncbi:MAG TPA: DUF1553 domain-containing protein [Gemmataceae bacterium]|nr:DUF1553 domain-containing protein [Gemmataceae bacterium]